MSREHLWNDIQKKTELHTQKTVPLPPCPPQIPHPAWPPPSEPNAAKRLSHGMLYIHQICTQRDDNGLHNSEKGIFGKINEPERSKRVESGELY